MNVEEIKNQVLNGKKINLKQAEFLLTTDLDELTEAANEIREFYLEDSFDLCSIINAKSGMCSENCKFCSQSSHFNSGSGSYDFLPYEEIEEMASYNASKGILRFSLVTSGRRLPAKDLDKAIKVYERLNEEVDIKLCASHGLLEEEDFIRLKAAGVVRYHNNLETSRSNFPNICTTHTYDDKIRSIKAAQRAGLEVCSGGILGLGETMSDRLEMLFDLRKLGIKSVPLNVLNPIPGTPLAGNAILTEEEVQRVIAVARFILPDAAIRMAGGRGQLSDKGKRVFMSGANGAISGDLLTTSGVHIDNDLDIIKSVGYQPELIAYGKGELQTVNAAN